MRSAKDKREDRGLKVPDLRSGNEEVQTVAGNSRPVDQIPVHLRPL